MSAVLTPEQRAVLDFEARWENARRDGAKAQAIADTFGLTEVAYCQVLNRLLDCEAALAHNPLLVNRLRRVRDARAELSLP
jgi:hypothetical protein